MAGGFAAGGADPRPSFSTMSCSRATAAARARCVSGWRDAARRTAREPSASTAGSPADQSIEQHGRDNSHRVDRLDEVPGAGVSVLSPGPAFPIGFTRFLDKPSR